MSSQPAPVALEHDQQFRFLKQFNDPTYVHKVTCRNRLRQSDVRWFPGDLLSSVFARALCEARAMPFKEVVESFEFFACIHRRIKTPSVADLCCGHGLVGVLCAIFEPNVERVLLLDKVRPASFDVVHQTAQKIAPWIEDKITYVTCPLDRAQTHLEPQSMVLAVHACGVRTDKSIQHAIEIAGPVAVLPCCRRHGPHPSPPCLKQTLGADLAIDVDRTYTLYNAGYRVRWDQIPASITPMNRVLVGTPPKTN